MVILLEDDGVKRRRVGGRFHCDQLAGELNLNARRQNKVMVVMWETLKLGGGKSRGLLCQHHTLPSGSAPNPAVWSNCYGAYFI
jgi:hypothetical protein